MRDISRYEADYLAGYGFERHMVRYRRRLVLERLAQYPHASVIEVGCGVEPLFEHVPDFAQWTVVEPASEFARVARERGAGRPVRVVEAFLEEAGAQLGHVHPDLVIVSSLLHEVSNPGALLESVRKLCADHTVVHVNTPNARSLHNELAVLMGLIPNVFARSPLANQMQRTSTWDVAGLRAQLEQAGFTALASGTFFLKPFTHGQLQRMLDAEIITEAALDALYAVNTRFDGMGAEAWVDGRLAK